MFRNEWDTFGRDSFFFCSCRSLLNGLAGLRSRSAALIFGTLNTILREDGYLTNILRLPFWVIGQIWISLFPAKLPPARE